METIPFPESVFGSFEKVYKPAEDSYLLLDALEADLESLKQSVSVAVECGSGSGAIITALGKAIGYDRLLIGCDINPAACKMTQLCATHNKQFQIQVVQSDLVSPLLDRLQRQVDLLIFNPPYVPTVREELLHDNHNQINLAYAGGKQGRHITDRFLFEQLPLLISKPHGVAYLVALEKNDIDDLTRCLENQHNILGKIVMHRNAGIESLFVIKYSWKSG